MEETTAKNRSKANLKNKNRKIRYSHTRVSHWWEYFTPLQSFSSEDTGWSNNGPLSIAVSFFLLLSWEDPSSLHVFFGLGFLIYFIEVLLLSWQTTHRNISFCKFRLQNSVIFLQTLRKSSCNSQIKMAILADGRNHSRIMLVKPQHSMIFFNPTSVVSRRETTSLSSCNR